MPICSSYLFPSHTKVSSTFYLLILLIEGIEFNQRSKSYLYILNCIQSYKRDAVTSAKYFAQRKYGCIDDARFQVRSTKGVQFRAISDWRTILTQSSSEIKYRPLLSPTTSISTPLLLSPLSATADLPLHYRLDKHLPLVSESHSSRATLRFRSWPCGEATAIWRKKRRRERKKKASLLG